MTRQASTQQDYPDALSEAFDAGKGKCPKCLGDGRVAGGTDDPDPWPVWEALPPGSDLAVQLGLVYPMTCTACDGTGEKPGSVSGRRAWADFDRTEAANEAEKDRDR